VAAGNSIRRYKAREFAKLSGVTVRALHHYGEQDLVRPEQIVALFARPKRASDGEDPAGERGQALAARRAGLVDEEPICGQRKLAQPGEAADAAVPD
jgi:hypothetical protein